MQRSSDFGVTSSFAKGPSNRENHHSTRRIHLLPSQPSSGLQQNHLTSVSAYPRRLFVLSLPHPTSNAPASAGSRPVFTRTLSPSTPNATRLPPSLPNRGDRPLRDSAWRCHAYDLLNSPTNTAWSWGFLHPRLTSRHGFSPARARGAVHHATAAT